MWLNELYQHLDPVAVSFGPFAIRWYGLAYLAGFLFAAIIIYRTQRHWGLDLVMDDLVSIMTGIITYVSVIERTKEIGILRACGARKKDVGRLFVAECFTIGLFAGLLGVGVAYAISVPLNTFLCSLYTEYTLRNLVVLSGWTVLLLLGIAIALGLIASFIPARMASRKDPVVALRSE